MTETYPHGPTPDCLSPLEIDEHSVDDETEQARKAHAAHLEQCVHCKARVEAAARQAEVFLQRLPDRVALEAHVKERRQAEPPAGRVIAGPWKPLRRAMPVLAGGLAVAAAVLLMVDTGGQDPGAGVRTKGAARLGVYIEHGGHVRKGKVDDVVHPGDTLRFTYTSNLDRYLAVWGNDGTGLELYHPQGGARAVPAPRGKDVALSFGVELDDHLGQETYYGVFCAEALATSAMRSGLDAEPPEAPAGCAVDVLRLRKQAAP